MEVSSTAIEQPNQRGVEMPVLVRARGSNPDLWLGRMNTLSRLASLVGSNQAVPS